MNGHACWSTPWQPPAGRWQTSFHSDHQAGWKAVAFTQPGTQQPGLPAHLPSGLSAVPVGNAVSSTHCCPPQSKPRISSLQPTRLPSLHHKGGEQHW